MYTYNPELWLKSNENEEKIEIKKIKNLMRYKIIYFI